MDANEIKVDYTVVGTKGRIKLVLTLPDGTFTDTFNATSFKSRRRFMNDLVGEHPGIIVEVIDRELEKIAAELAKPKGDDDSEDSGAGSDNELLIKLGSDADGLELFHRGSPSDGDAFAQITVGDHLEVWGIRTRQFASWLRQEFYKVTQRSPSAQAFADAINTLDAKACFSGPMMDVHLRVAPFEGKIVLDLCDESWSVVIVDPANWRVSLSAKSPVRFTRKRGMLALPSPVRGGSIEELRPFLNFKSDEQWRLFACSLLTLMLPSGPYAVLVLTGEQGSAKSTTIDRTRAVIDPTSSPRRQLPKDLRDLMIAAESAHVLSFDNLSHISPAISDALCMLSTGGGVSVRELYTDREETIFNAKRPVLLNGIEDVTTRPDLLDRSVIFDLPAIPDGERREEAEMEVAFVAARPRILGALLDALCRALALHPRIQLSSKPRMADYARWGAAAEQAFGFPEGSFLAAYTRNRGEAHSIAIENSAVGAALLALVRDQRDWTGTAGELMETLETRYADERTKQRKDWPRKPRGMAEALKRISPALRASGVIVETGERASDFDRTRLIHLSLRPESGAAHRAPDDPDGLDDVVATQNLDTNSFPRNECDDAGPQPNFIPQDRRGTQSSRPSGSSGLAYDPADAAADNQHKPDATEDDQGDLFSPEEPEDEQ